MKFVNIEIPVYVQYGSHRAPHTVSVAMTTSGDETELEIVERLGRALERVCETVSLGDEE